MLGEGAVFMCKTLISFRIVFTCAFTKIFPETANLEVFVGPFKSSTEELIPSNSYEKTYVSLNSP